MHVASCSHTDFCHQSCNTVLNNCRMNATCKPLLGGVEESCKNIFAWDEFSNETEPVCSNKCKKNLIKLEKLLDKDIRCCKCGEITDDHSLSDISAISCHQLSGNIDRWCPNTVTSSLSTCPECERQGCNIIPIIMYV